VANVSRYFFAGAIVLSVAGIVHCATIMGVEEATLRPEAGTTPSPADGSVSPGEDAGPEPCVGEGCPCTDANDCKDRRFSRCVAGRCMECSTEPDGGCDILHYCLEGDPDAPPDAGVNRFNQCVPGCTSDDACKAFSDAIPYCVVARHECVMCRPGSPCPNLNDGCSSAGACVSKCGEGRPCPEGRLCCDGLCVDPKSDIFNCKECGKVCEGDDAACCDGECKRKLTSDDACGACAHRCSETEQCVGGRCTAR